MKMKKRGLLFLMMLFALMITAAPASAASQKSKAIAAYKKYMANQSGSTKFAVVYLDNNSVPELLTYGKVLTYKGGKVQECSLASNFRSYEYSLYEIKGYYKKKGIIVHAYGGGGGASPAFINYYSKMSGTTIKKIIGDNNLGSTNLNTMKTTWKHTYLKFPTSDAVQISKSAFQKKLKSLVKGRKYTKIKWRMNTASNRKKYIK